MNLTASLPALGRRTRGPVVACRAGKVGLEYACGHFVVGLPVTTPGVAVRAALDPLAPCPTCWPKGYAYHMAAFSPEAQALAESIGQRIGGGPC